MSVSLPSIPLETLQIFRSLDTIDVVRLGMVSRDAPYLQTWMIDNQFCTSHVKICTSPPGIATSGLIKCRVTFGRLKLSVPDLTISSGVDLKTFAIRRENLRPR